MASEQRPGIGLVGLAFMAFIFIVIYLGGLGSVITTTSQINVENSQGSGIIAFVFSNMHLFILLFFFTGLIIGGYWLTK